MRQKNKLGLAKSLAVDAIQSYYHSKPKALYEEIKEITSFYSCHNKIVVRLHQKIHKLEMNNIILRSVLNNCSELKRNLIIGKYRDHKSLVALSLNLHTSVSQLTIWHNDVLDDIQAMMFYRIREQDIFSREKIMNMIHILDQQIEFLEDISQEFVDPNIIYALQWRKDRYVNLYQDLMRAINSPTETKGNVLRFRSSPHCDASLSTIAKECDVSIASVSSYLLEFKKEICEQEEYADLIAR